MVSQGNGRHYSHDGQDGDEAGVCDQVHARENKELADVEEQHHAQQPHREEVDGFIVFQEKLQLKTVRAWESIIVLYTLFTVSRMPPRMACKPMCSIIKTYVKPFTLMPSLCTSVM